MRKYIDCFRDPPCLGDIAHHFWMLNYGSDETMRLQEREFYRFLCNHEYEMALKYACDNLNQYPGAPNLRFQLYNLYMFLDQKDASFKTIEGLFKEYPDCLTLRKFYESALLFKNKSEEIERTGAVTFTDEERDWILHKNSK